jgi:prepilin-type N-terminal cleavage/methylation domain-containing protein
MSDRPRKAKKGFSLIELVVAAALSTLLFVGIVQVLRGIQTQHQVAIRADEKTRWHESFVRPLESDLSTARSLVVSPYRIEFVGYAATDDETRNALFRPGRIIYEIQYREDSAFVMRHEKLLDEQAGAKKASEFVCLGIHRFELMGFDPSRRAWRSLAWSGLDSKKLNAVSVLRIIGFGSREGNDQLFDELIFRYPGVSEL